MARARTHLNLMPLRRDWRTFRRMQDTAAAAAALVYGAAAIEAWRILPLAPGVKLGRLAILPGLLMGLTLVAALLTPLLRGALLRHLWISYRTGFGQSVISVLAGVGVLIVLAALAFWPLARGASHGAVAHGGGAFSAYGAGVGLLLAQAVLTRRIEADPILRRQIEL